MHSLRKLTVGAAILGTTLTGGAVGALLLNGGAASAQTDSSSTTSASSSDSSSTTAPDASARPARDPSQAGHTANGITEELLTGDVAAKVTAAAQAAVSDGTIERVETDAEGAMYEAHIVKADGTHVTVKVGADFTVSSIEDGMK